MTVRPMMSPDPNVATITGCRPRYNSSTWTGTTSPMSSLLQIQQVPGDVPLHIKKTAKYPALVVAAYFLSDSISALIIVMNLKMPTFWPCLVKLSHSVLTTDEHIVCKLKHQVHAFLICKALPSQYLWMCLKSIDPNLSVTGTSCTYSPGSA